MTFSDPTDPKLHALRVAFDGSFAIAARAEPRDQLDFLALRIAGDPYAVRLSEVQSLHASKALALAPSRLPALLGMAGFRGVLTPIYDLGQLLGYAGEPSAKWLIVAESAAPIGFAFGAFDAHLRLGSERVSPPAHGSQCVDPWRGAERRRRVATASFAFDRRRNCGTNQGLRVIAGTVRDGYQLDVWSKVGARVCDRGADSDHDWVLRLPQYRALDRK